MSLIQILAEARHDGDDLHFHIPDEWLQGRTCFGGLSAVLAMETAKQLVPDLPPIRSAQIAFVGPLSGNVSAKARLLRQGRNATWVACEIASEKGIGLFANFVFMGAVDSALHLNDFVAPDPFIPAHEARLMNSEKAPAFKRNNFETRWGQPPAQTPKPEVCWWVRAHETSQLAPTTDLLLCGDALPPGVLPMVDWKTPISSMMWQANFLTAEPQTEDGWWLAESIGNYSEKGCSSQKMTMWNTRGEAVMSGIQSVAIFG